MALIFMFLVINEFQCIFIFSHFNITFPFVVRGLFECSFFY